MRVLVIYCHPVPESYSAALRDRVLSSASAAGHETRLIDLHAGNFDPVMRADERRSYNEMTARDHPLPDHAADLAWAQAMVFVYPTWWYGLPAMLKGWLERVFTPGVAFEVNRQGGAIIPLLAQIRRVAIVTTCGAPFWLSFLVGQPGRKTLLRGMRALFARNCRTLYLAHYLMDVSTPQSRAAFLDRVAKRLPRFLGA